MVRVRERVRQCELRAVGHAVEPDLGEAERLPDGVQVLGVVGCRVEVSLGAEPRAARRRGVALGVRRVRDLKRGAVEQTGVAGAAVVVGDERVPGKEVVVERDVRRGVETEHVGRALSGTAGDEEHHAAVDSLARDHLDMKGHRARHDAGAVERHDHLRANHARVLAAWALCLRGRRQRADEGARVERGERRQGDGRRPGRRGGGRRQEQQDE